MIKNILIGAWLIVCAIFSVYANACKQSADRQTLAVLENKVKAIENMEMAKSAELKAIESAIQERTAQRKIDDIKRQLENCN